MYYSDAKSYEPENRSRTITGTEHIVTPTGVSYYDERVIYNLTDKNAHRVSDVYYDSLDSNYTTKRAFDVEIKYKLHVGTYDMFLSLSVNKLKHQILQSLLRCLCVIHTNVYVCLTM